MAQENMISVVFTDADITKAEAALKALAEVMVKGKSLTPKERQNYGRVKYEKEVWVSKVKIHMDNNPDRIPNYIDKAEYDRDFEAHTLLNKWAGLMEQQLNVMEDTNRLLGFDLDQSSLMFYRDIKIAAKNNAPGARTIFEDLKQQFSAGGSSKKDNPTP